MFVNLKLSTFEEETLFSLSWRHLICPNLSSMYHWWWGVSRSVSGGNVKIDISAQVRLTWWCCDTDNISGSQHLHCQPHYTPADMVANTHTRGHPALSIKYSRQELRCRDMWTKQDNLVLNFSTVVASKIRIFLFGTFLHDWLYQISTSWWVLKSSGHEEFKTHPGSSIWSILGWVIWVKRKVVYSESAQSPTVFPWLSLSLTALIFSSVTW